MSYKQHITRLKEIYINHKSNFLSAKGKFHLSRKIGVALYGRNGLKQDERYLQDWQEKRENSWNDEVHIQSLRWQFKYRGDAPSSIFVINSNDKLYGEWKKKYLKTSTQISGELPTADIQKNANKVDNFFTKDNSDDIRFRCLDEEMPEIDVVMLGLYRLDEEQFLLYTDFINMLLDFDYFDVTKIIKDIQSNYKLSNNLVFYSGADLERKNSDDKNNKMPATFPSTTNELTVDEDVINHISRNNSADIIKTQIGYSSSNMSDVNIETALDAVIMGHYILNMHQLEIYTRFSHLLISSFDWFEVKKILKDAINDFKTLNPLHNFDGTSL